ncbi:hypothetical protein JCM10450v2_002621 [Rhodotorula kratochvilovae]
MDDAGAESDASALTALDELELAWDLAASPPVDPPTSPAPLAVQGALEDSEKAASTSDGPSPTRSTPAARPSAAQSASKRRGLPLPAPQYESSSDEGSRITGADERGRTERARKRARRDRDAPAVEEEDAMQAEETHKPLKKKHGAGKKAARRAKKLARKAAAEEAAAQPASQGVKAELRMLGGDMWAALGGTVDSPRSSRRASVPAAASPAVVQHPPSPSSSALIRAASAGAASPAPRLTRRSSLAAPDMHAPPLPPSPPKQSLKRDLQSLAYGYFAASSVDADLPRATRRSSDGAAADKRVPKLRAAEASPAAEGRAPLSKKQRKKAAQVAAEQDNANVGLAPSAVLAPATAPALMGSAAPFPGASAAADDELPTRRAHKPPKRYVDEVDAALLQAQSSPPKRKAPPPPPPPAPLPPAKVQVTPLRDLGLDRASRDRPMAGFLTTEPLLPPQHKGNGWPSTRKAVIIQPQDPELHLPQVALPLNAAALPPLPSATAAPIAGPSRAPPPPKRAPAPLASTAPKPFKPSKPRARHPALDSRAGWVPVERDLRITPAGKPPIWCQGRQELCESLEYFRSYQGGHYDTQERCLGYLLDGFPSPSDACAQRGKVIISHGGGCGEVLPSGYRLRASQTREGTRVRALRNCMETRTPVVLLAGAMYEHFPRLKDMGEGGVRYAVLGHYLVTDIWAEGEPVEGATNGKFFVRFKVRFEWLESQGTPWFAEVIGKDDAALKPANPLAGLRFKRISTPASTAPPTAASSDMDISADEDASPAPHSPKSDRTVDSGFVDATTPDAEAGGTARCASCAVEHKRVYREEVACYNEECERFFQVNGAMPPAGSLTYLPSFLSLSPSLPSSNLVPQPLAPRTLQSLSGASQIADYSYLAWRGFGCSACGRLSSRGEWTRLVCAGCGAETDATARVFGAAELEAKGTVRACEAGPAFLLAPHCMERIVDVKGYNGYSVDLSPADGSGLARVHHLWPVELTATREADRLFEEYQGEEAGKLFRRNKLARHCAAGALLCQQFTFNAGERYSHAVSMATYPFPPPPSASTSNAAAERDDDKKEVLMCAPECARDARDYLKTVVRSVVGENEQTDFNEILSVAYMTGGKMNYHDDGERGLGSYVASVSLGSGAIMSFRAKVKKQRTTAAKKGGDQDGGDADDEGDEVGGKKEKSKGSRVVLKARLKHGHVLIMEGADMQKLFEHKVEPEGLRFAATARWVGPDHLLPRSKSSSVQPTTAPAASSSRFTYQDSSQPLFMTRSLSGRKPPAIIAGSATDPSPLSNTTLPTLPLRPALPPLNLPKAHPTFPRIPPSTIPNASLAASPGVPPRSKLVQDPFPRYYAPPPPQLLHAPVYPNFPTFASSSSSSGSGMRIPVLIGPPTAAPDEPFYPRANSAAVALYAPVAPPPSSMYTRAVGTFSSAASAVASSFAGRAGGAQSAQAVGAQMRGSAYRHSHPEAFYPGALVGVNGRV